MTLASARRDLQIEILHVAVPGLCVYYALIATAHAVVLDGSVRLAMAGLAALTCLSLGVLTPFRDREAILLRTHLVALVIGLVVAANSILHVALTGEAFQTTNLVLTAIAAAAFLTSTRSFVLMLAVVAFGWAGAVVAHPGDPLWPHFGFALLGAYLIAGLGFAIRSRVTRRQFEAEVARAGAAAAALAHETRYRAVVSLSPAAILVHRLGTVRFANTAAAQLIGAHQESVILGSPLFDLFPPVDQERIRVWSETTLAGNGDQEPLECRLRALEGAWPYVELSTSAITWEGEDAAILVATDVTARRETARRKDELVAMVGYELRNPVTAALRALDQFPAEDDARAAELVASASHNLGQLRLILDDLNDLELAQSGRLELTLAPLNLVVLLTEAVGDFSPLAGRSNVWVEEAPSPGELLVQGDGTRLGQVIGCLLANALRVSKSGQVIHVALSVAGDSARVEVRDEGPPIPEGLRSRIFERFARDPEETTSDGLGLGLAISKLLVESHGGEIGLESLDSGTAFWFTVPRAMNPSSNL